MMCSYCGSQLNQEYIQLWFDNEILQLCDEECAIYYFQEQQQRYFQSWVKIR